MFVNMWQPLNSPGLAFMARVLHTSSGMVNVVATAPCNDIHRCSSTCLPCFVMFFWVSCSPAWAVGSYSSGPAAGRISQILKSLVIKTLWMTEWNVLYTFYSFFPVLSSGWSCVVSWNFVMWAREPKPKILLITKVDLIHGWRSRGVWTPWSLQTRERGEERRETGSANTARARPMTTTGDSSHRPT